MRLRLANHPRVPRAAVTSKDRNNDSRNHARTATRHRRRRHLSSSSGDHKSTYQDGPNQARINVTKPKTLMDTIAAQPPDSTSRPVNYLDRLKQRDPGLHSQLMEVMDSFIAGQTVYTRFPTVTKLYKYLTEQGVVAISECQFRVWLRNRERQNEKK